MNLLEQFGTYLARDEIQKIKNKAKFDSVEKDMRIENLERMMAEGFVHIDPEGYQGQGFPTIDTPVKEPVGQDAVEQLIHALYSIIEERSGHDCVGTDYAGAFPDIGRAVAKSVSLPVIKQLVPFEFSPRGLIQRAEYSERDVEEIRDAFQEGDCDWLVSRLDKCQPMDHDVSIYYLRRNLKQVRAIAVRLAQYGDGTNRVNRCDSALTGSLQRVWASNTHYKREETTHKYQGPLSSEAWAQALLCGRPRVGK